MVKVLPDPARVNVGEILWTVISDMSRIVRRLVACEVDTIRPVIIHVTLYEPLGNDAGTVTLIVELSISESAAAVLNEKFIVDES